MTGVLGDVAFVPANIRIATLRACVWRRMDAIIASLVEHEQNVAQYQNMTSYLHLSTHQRSGLIAQGRGVGFAWVMCTSPVKAGADATT